MRQVLTPKGGERSLRRAKSGKTLAMARFDMDGESFFFLGVEAKD